MIHCKTVLDDSVLLHMAEVSQRNKPYTKKRNTIKTITLIFGLFIIGMNGFYFVNRLVRYNLANIPALLQILVGVLFLIVATRIKAIQKSMILKDLRMKVPKNTPDAQVSTEYFFDENGVRILSSVGQAQYPWTAFRERGMTDEYYYMLRSDEGSIVVEKSDLSPEDNQALWQLLERKIPGSTR